MPFIERVGALSVPHLTLHLMTSSAPTVAEVNDLIRAYTATPRAWTADERAELARLWALYRETTRREYTPTA